MSVMYLFSHFMLVMFLSHGSDCLCEVAVNFMFHFYPVFVQITRWRISEKEGKHKNMGINTAYHTNNTSKTGDINRHRDMGVY